METSPAAVRRYLGYWVGQCVIREEASDTYTLVDNFDDISDKGQGGCGQLLLHVIAELS